MPFPIERAYPLPIYPAFARPNQTKLAHQTTSRILTLSCWLSGFLGLQS